MSDETPLPHNLLNPADADALDALAEAGFEPERVPPFLRDRAVRVASLLGLLESNRAADTPSALAADAGRSILIDVTMARVLRARAHTTLRTTAAPPAAPPDAWLSDADSLALDALISADWSPEAVDAPHATRAARIATLLSSLDLHPDAAEAISTSREDLVAATVARVQLAGAAARRSASSTDAPILRTGGFRLADLLTAAAAVLIAFSIIWPTLSFNRSLATRAACETSLQNASLGFSLYAGDNNGALPRVGAGFAPAGPGGKWWDVGDPTHSHSANLFVLVTEGYTTLADLACRGNARAPINLQPTSAPQNDWRTPEEVSFSYQLFPAGNQSARWRGPGRVLILADKSPVVDRARRGELFDPLARSLNHGAQGQNVLFNDGSVEWLVRPELPGADNIWLPRSADASGAPIRLQGKESPADAHDAFVGP